MEDLLADVHALDEAAFQRVNVLDHAIKQQLAGRISHDLMDSDDNAPCGIRFKGFRLDVWIDHAPLPRPIGAHAFMAMNHSAFHSVGPNDIGLHRG